MPQGGKPRAAFRVGKYIVTVDYVEVLGAEHVSERGGGQESSGVRGVSYVYHGGHWVEHFEVNHGVHGDSNAVFCENLLRRDVEGDEPQVHSDDVVNAGKDCEEAGTHGATLLNPPEPEDHGSLVFLNGKEVLNRQNCNIVYSNVT